MPSHATEPAYRIPNFEYNMKNSTSYTFTLSVKVTPDFAAQVREAAAQRKVEISVVLREMLGIQTLPVGGSVPTQSAAPASVVLKSRARRPMRLAPPGGSDPVVVRLLASVATGLSDTAQAIASNDALIAAADVANWLSVLQSMEVRLAQLIEHEDRKNAH